MELGDVATWVAAVVAVGGGVVASVQARKANRAADASAEAAKRSADADERAAAAAEKANEIAQRYNAVWRIAHEKSDTWRVINETGEKAWGAVLTCGTDLNTRFPDDAMDVEPGGGIPFLAVRLQSTGNEQVTVTWHRRQDESDEALQWTDVLPRRPR
jgi:hypothetical protein